MAHMTHVGHLLLQHPVVPISEASPVGLVWMEGQGKPVDGKNEMLGNGKKLYKKEQKANDSHRVIENSIEDTTLYSLDEVPDKIDTAWWRKYSHNFVCRGNNFFLKHAR